MRHQWIPNDTMYVQQWALGTGVGGIRAANAWDLTPSGSVAVAVIDTGIRSHPDLDAKRMAGYDMISNLFIANDGDGRDGNATDPGDYDDALDCRGGGAAVKGRKKFPRLGAGTELPGRHRPL